MRYICLPLSNATLVCSNQKGLHSKHNCLKLSSISVNFEKIKDHKYNSDNLSLTFQFEENLLQTKFTTANPFVSKGLSQSRSKNICRSSETTHAAPSRAKGAWKAKPKKPVKVSVSVKNKQTPCLLWTCQARGLCVGGGGCVNRQCVSQMLSRAWRAVHLLWTDNSL